MKRAYNLGFYSSVEDEKRKNKIIIVTILAMTVVLRLFLAISQGQHMFLGTDDDNYRESAQVLLKRGTLTYGGWPEPTVFIMPGYPIFLAAVFFVFGSPNWLAARLVQVIISSVGLWLSMWFGWKLGGKNTAIVAGVFSALYPPNLTVPLFLMTELLFTVMFLVSLWCFVRSKEEGSIKWLVLTAISIGISIYFRPTSGIMPLFFVPYYLADRFPVRTIIKNIGVIFGVIILTIIPWIARNYLLYRDFIPLTVSSGNPFLRGTYLDDKISEKFPWVKGERTLSDQAQMELGKKRFIKGFSTNFKAYLSWYTIGKFKKLWAEPYYYVQLNNLPAGLAGQIHRFLMWCGLAGIILGIWHKKDIVVLFLSLCVYFTLVYQLFLAAPRYSYPVVQLVLIAAAYFIVELFRVIGKDIRL